MKKTIKLLVASVIAVAAFMPTKASAQKFGHINSQEIVALMPERDEAFTKLQAFGKELNETVMKKAQDAIDKVAKAQGLAYVFDLATGAIIYIDEANTVNLLPLVKAELGIPASKTQPTQFQ